MNQFYKINKHFRDSMTDDKRRIFVQFFWVYTIMLLVSSFMTIVNLFTGRTVLMLATAIFAVCCAVNIVIARLGKSMLNVSIVAFTGEMLALFVFFIVSGEPEGFSAIWVCLIPTCGMLLYKRIAGTVISAVMLVVLIFFFQTPIGNSFLQFEYTDSFMLRFPMLYTAFFATSFFLESVRQSTYDKLKDAEQKYEFMYNHDALTGLLNRYGFDSRMAKMMKGKKGSRVALLILDIDFFKKVNDLYGHVNGDGVLRSISAYMLEMCLGEADICRWGGEEFAILYSGEADPCELAEKIRAAVEAKTIPVGESEVKITVSIGVAESVLKSGASPDELISAADRCLLLAKQNGRNRVESCMVN